MEEGAVGDGTGVRTVVIGSFPYSSPSVSDFLASMRAILEVFCPNVIIISRRSRYTRRDDYVLKSGLKWYDDASPGFSRAMAWVALFLLSQIETGIHLLRIRKDLSHVVFFPGSNYFVPLLVCRISGLASILVTGGSPKGSLSAYPMHIRIPFAVLTRFCYLLANRVALETKREVCQLGFRFRKTSDKFNALGARFIDLHQFAYEPLSKSRLRRIGYVGRLIQGKGADAFVRAAFVMISRNSNLEFHVIGDGPLRRTLTEQVKSRNLERHFRFQGWVDYRDMPRVLRTLGFVVLPSESEGLPTSLLEAMACGAIAAATPVGGIPDVIVDGVTGLILCDAEPDTIADKVLKAAESENVQHISHDARRLIETEFSLDAAVQRYKRLMRDIQSDSKDAPLDGQLTSSDECP